MTHWEKKRTERINLIINYLFIHSTNSRYSTEKVHIISQMSETDQSIRASSFKSSHKTTACIYTSTIVAVYHDFFRDFE